jgi:putative transposase
VIFDVFLARITKENATMALDQSALTDLLDALRSGGDLDVFREAMQFVLQPLVELEAAQVVGAGRYERTETRTTHRNGARARLLSTKAGDVELQIPKLRDGSFYPSLLEPRRRIDRALWAVIMEAFVHGVSTRKVDDLVTALGIDAGVSKSQVSRICAELDTPVAEFRDRRLDHIEFPYLFLDATYVKAHDGPRVVSKAIIVATGVAADGNREVLGLAVGDSEDKAFWTGFLRSLRQRGLAGVRLVISDAHEGLRGVDRQGHAGRRLATLSSALLAQRVSQGAQRLGRDGGRRGQNDLRSTRRRRRRRPARCHRRQVGSPVPRRRTHAARRRRRPVRLRCLPASPLAQDLVDQPPRAGQQGDQAAHQRRGHLPQRSRRGPPRRLGAAEVHDEWQVTDRRYLSEGSMAKLYEIDNDDNITKEVGPRTNELLAG